MDALVVLDIQVGLLNGPPKHNLRGVLDRINQLTAMVRRRSGTVVWIQLNRQRIDIVAQKTLNDSFAGTDLQATLKRSPRTECSSLDGRPTSASTRRSGPRSRTITLSSRSAMDTH